jgi:hypothetical protein
MKRKITHVLLTLFALQAPIVGYAHEKGNNASADNQKPNCEAMENMDHSKMDMNDPAMQAIMQKCMKHGMEGNNMDHSKMDMNDPDMQAMMQKCMKHGMEGDNMDHSKMDMNDPDMQAMMQKCMKHGMEGNHMHNETEVEKSASETEKSSMQHKHKQ